MAEIADSYRLNGAYEDSEYWYGSLYKGHEKTGAPLALCTNVAKQW